jgi:hypothetical protein
MNTTLWSLQNFYTGESEVRWSEEQSDELRSFPIPHPNHLRTSLRSSLLSSQVSSYIHVVPFIKKTGKTVTKVSRFFSSPKKFLLSEPIAKLVILCSSDFSAVVDLEIEKHKQFVKDHAATIKMILKGLHMMSQVANVGAKILTGASLPFELPSTESFDSFLDSADKIVEGALEIAGEEGSEERETVRMIGDGKDVEAIKKVVGSGIQEAHQDYIY